MDPSQVAFWAGVGAAALCGALIGVERQLRGKPAGIRTSILICLGTMTFVRLGGLVACETGDPTRVLGQVVTGVGFIGAGVMLAREGLVRGVTSAAVIWVLAAVGALIGFDRYAAAFALAALVLVVLSGVQLLEQGVRHFRRGDYARDEESDPSDEQ